MEGTKRYKKDYRRYENFEGWEKRTISDQLHTWAEKYGEKIAVTAADGEISYKGLERRALEIASALLDLGIQKGDKVVVQLPNRLSFVEVLFGLEKAGAIPILMLPAHREAEVEGIIKLANPKAYIVAEQYLGYHYLSLATQMKEKYSCLQYIVVDGSNGGDLILDDLNGNICREYPTVDCYQPAVLLLSGGTTGIPKLIPRTHTDYIYNARMSAKRCKLSENDIYLAALPVAHNFPLSCPGLLGTLDAGGKIVLSPTTSPDDIVPSR